MKKTVHKISIIICTYNRAEILRECLQSLVEQTLSFEFYEVLVINNNSTDHTEEVVHEFSEAYPKFNYFMEKSVGVGFARNRGYLEAKYDWISYIDDDAKAHTNYVERALDTINKYGYECIGGIFLPWYKYGSAKWIPKDKLSNAPEELDESVKIIKKYNACAGAIIFKKETLAEVGGFPVDYSMKGNELGYGEEDDVQKKLRKVGYTIGIDHGLRIDHLVAKYKLDWRWHIKAAYAHGVAEIDVNQVELKHPILFFIIGCLVLPILRIPHYFWKFITNKTYFWQNFLIDWIGEAMHYKGRYDRFIGKQSIKKMG